MTWTQYGHHSTRVNLAKGDVALLLHVCPDPRTTRMYDPDAPIVELRAVPDPEGDYMGWTDADSPDRLHMVQHHRIFNIQFPYGWQAEQDAGRGTAHRIRLEPVTAPNGETHG